ncbi:unnamed protein product [Bemisia tabaci]|uniref:acylaminoacyl-peptidase n=1 Tax=Bemisia tabaci TaxID=7038 RepID=A0A9N9ZYZ6_BEMTA|nr:unnamed protein product [Bemisia tabaci]
MINRLLRRVYSTMTVQVEEVVEVFRSVARHPAPTGATILKGNQGGFAIVSTWSQRSLEHGRRVKFQLTNLIDSSLNQPISTLPVDVSSVVLSSISKSEKLKAVVQEITAENSSKKYVLEIWRTHQLWRSFDLTALDVHGDIYYDRNFGCLEWSPCEKKLLFVAEAKKPKAEPFFKSKSGSKESESKPGEPKPLKGEEYVYREEWGEQLVGKHQSCLVVCDIESESISVCPGVPPEYCPGSAVWSPEGHIVGVCVQSTPRRLGLVYCSNRPSFIFQLTLDGSFKIISNKKMSAMSPRFSPDGKILVYLERVPTGAHRACMQIIKYHWPSGNSEVIFDIVSHQKTICNNNVFYGVFCDSLPKRCFSKDSKYVVFSTEQKFQVSSYILDIESGSLNQLVLNEKGSVQVLDVDEDLVVCAKSSFAVPFSLIVSHLSFDGITLWTPLTDWCQDASPSNLVVKYMSLTAPNSEEVNSFSAIYFGPESGEPQSVPLVVVPHGGPHACILDSFNVFSADFYTRLGFATLFPNYRGSTGQGQASVDYLLGKVGDTDVKDVHQATCEALKTFPCLNQNAVVLSGGSHGGFLVAHLSAQYPNFYKAVVSRNPALELSSMFMTSDIPDWCTTEAGFLYKGYTGDNAVWEKMRNVSPMKLVDKICAPTLFLIGKNDLRVPPSQGTALYHALRERNVETKMHVYADNHSLFTIPVELDSCINAALWLIQHIEVRKS